MSLIVNRAPLAPGGVDGSVNAYRPSAKLPTMVRVSASTDADSPSQPR